MGRYAEKRVTARKVHRCITCDRPVIHSGDVYLRFVIFPESGMGYGSPLTGNECACCVEKSGRLHLLEPLPTFQAQEVYLNAMREGRG